MGEELDQSKPTQRVQPRIAAWKTPEFETSGESSGKKPESSGELELLRRANELDAARARFARLDEVAQLDEAQEAGYITAEEYARKRGLRSGDPNIYRQQLKALERKKK